MKEVLDELELSSYYDAFVKVSDLTRSHSFLTSREPAVAIYTVRRGAVEGRCENYQGTAIRPLTCSVVLR